MPALKLGLLLLGIAAPIAFAQNTNSPAHASAWKFMRGANCGNYLEVPPNQNRSVRHTTNDLVRMRAEGFDHVRIPIGWHHHTGPSPEFHLTPEIFSKVDALVNRAVAIGLNVIINIHHFDTFTSDPDQHKDQFYSIWRQIAAHYASAPPALAFELINEPKDKATTAVMNPIYAEAIKQIRKTNPTRTIFVGPGRYNNIQELPQLVLPDDDSNIVVTVHNYDPFYFTHQGASWTKPTTDTKGILFPGPPTTPLSPAPTVASNKLVVSWIKDYNTLPSDRNPSSPREGLGWAIWDWKAGFKYWDDKKQQPLAGMRDALFGP